MTRPAGRARAALVLALGCLLLPAPSAAAESPAAGEPCVGVVVDARLLGGSVTVRCAEGDPDSGLRALTAAGLSYAFVPRQAGLVCQLDGTPACSRTSTTTYWSYWHRAPGSGRWRYSSEGAATFDPAPGSLEGWVWQEGGRRKPPRVALPEPPEGRPASPRSTDAAGAAAGAGALPAPVDDGRGGPVVGLAVGAGLVAALGAAAALRSRSSRGRS